MRKTATLLVSTLLCLWLTSCSLAPANPLIGTWKSDRDLTVDSNPRDREGHKLTGREVDQMMGDATLTFSDHRATVDTPSLSITQSEFGYSVVSADARSVKISLQVSHMGTDTTDTFHFDSNDVMWTENENRIQLLPNGKFRQYYRRQR